MAKSRQKGTPSVAGPAARQELAVRWLAIGKVKPYPTNPRGTEAAIQGVASSIIEFGWQAPIVTDRKYVVIAGHVRLQAAQRIGLREVPVHVAEHLTEAQARAYRLADNRTAENATWDRALLGNELKWLEAAGANLESTGFGETEWERLIRSAETRVDPNADLDEAGPKPAKPKTKPGDIIELGIHRLVCGSAADPEAWDRLLGDRWAVDLLWTDPPYNVAYEKKNRSLNKHDGQRRNEGTIAGRTATRRK